VKFSNEERITIKETGTVDYATGRIVINSIIINEYDGDTIKIYGVPADKDVAAKRNIILKLDPSEIEVDVEAIYL
jgi:hypothetical protein